MTDLEPEDTLLSVTAELGTQYKVWKKGETEKNKQKEKFFKLVNQHFDSETLAEQIVTVRAQDEDQARDLVAKSHPKWIVEDLRTDPGDSDDENGPIWDVIIVENPEFKSYSFVNPDDGQVYTRQVQSGSIMFDDERLQEKDSELWREVTRIPNRDIILGLLDEYDASEYDPGPEEVLDSMWEKFGGTRDLIPFEDLPPDTLARLGEYIYEGKPTTKLAAPRKAKEEDLASSSEV